MSGRLVIILGPTAVGKTAFAIAKAKEYGSPVISCDSRQIFQKMTIGTAVPSPSQLAEVRHHFIQTVPVTQSYTAGDYERDAVELGHHDVLDFHAQGTRDIVLEDDPL